MKTSSVQVVMIAAVVSAIAAASAALALRKSRTNAARKQCVANLQRVGQAISSYWTESNRTWPFIAKLPSSDLHDPPWQGMAAVLGRHVGTSEAFHCPADRRTLADEEPLRKKFPARTTYFETEGTSYEWLLMVYGGRPVGKETVTGKRAFGGGAADQPIMWDFEPFHGGTNVAGALNILYADLAVRSDDFQQKLRDYPGE